MREIKFKSMGKETSKQKVCPLIYIEWSDSTTLDDGWKEIDEIIDWADNSNWVIRQVGYLIKETKEHIVLASQHNPQIDYTDQYSTFHKIPKTRIMSRKYINLNEC